MKKKKSLIAGILIAALASSNICTQYGAGTAFAQSYMRSDENIQNKASESNTAPSKGIIASVSNLLKADGTELVELEDSDYHYQETVNGVTITIDAEAGAIPEKTITVITPVEKKVTKNQLVAFDIQFMLDGKEIQPESEVNVSFSMEELPKDAEIFHISDKNKQEEVSSTVQGDGKISFKADHFSVYGIALADTSDDPLGNPLVGGTADGDWQGNYVYYGWTYKYIVPEVYPEHYNYMAPMADSLNMYSLYSMNGKKYMGRSYREPIKWRILHNDGNTLLLLSDKMLGVHDWNNMQHESEWGQSDIRKYLNEDLMQEMFFEEEEALVCDTLNKGEFNISGENLDSIDRMFLPSASELKNAQYGFPSGSGACKARVAEYSNPDDQIRHTWNDTSYWLRSKPLESEYSWMPQYVEASGGIGMYAYTYCFGIRPMIRVSVENEYLCTSENDEMLSYGLRFQNEKETMLVGENFNLILQSIGQDFDLSKAEWGSTDENVVTVDNQGKVSAVVSEESSDLNYKKSAYVYAHIGQHFAGCLITVTNSPEEKVLIAYPQVSFGETERNLRVHFIENSGDDKGIWYDKVITAYDMPDDGAIIIKNPTSKNIDYRIRTFGCSNDSNIVFDEKISPYRGEGVIEGEKNHIFRLADIWLDDERTYLLQVSAYENGFDSPIIYEQWFFITTEHRGFSGRNNGWCLVNRGESFGYGETYNIPVERYYDVFGTSITTLFSLIDFSNWGGNCFGLSLLSVANYNGIINLEKYFDAVSVTNSDLYSYGYNEIKKNEEGQYYSIEKNKKLIELIERAQISQTTDIIKDCEVFKNDTKNGYYGELLSYLNKAKPNPLIICLSYRSLLKDINGNHPHVGHAMVVNTSIQPEDLDNGWYRLYLYDSNHPGYAAGLYEPMDEYIHKPSYIEINVNTGKWEFSFCDTVFDEDSDRTYLDYFKDGRGNINNKESICFFDVSKLDEKFFVDKLEYDRSIHSSYISGRSFSICDNAGTVLAKVVDNDLLHCSDNVEVIPYCQGKNGDFCGYFNIDDSTYLIIADSECEFINYDSNYMSYGNIQCGDVLIDTNSGTVIVKNTNKSEICLQNNETLQAVMFEDNLSEGDNVIVTLSNDSKLTLKTNKNTLAQLKIENKNNIVDLSASNIKDSHNMTVNGIKIFTNEDDNSGNSGNIGGNGGSSGGGSSSGGGGGSSRGGGGSRSSSGGPGSSLPSYVEKGEWSLLNGFWHFTDVFGNLKVNTWTAAYNPYATAGQQNYDWFRFDENGNMVTGWFTDVDGNRYFLNPVSDGTLGKMLIGWVWIADESGAQKCYYFNPNSDGYRGKLFINMVVDGYTVDENGCWTINGVVQVK